ncbi:hypothetical protein BME24068_05147 [Burkholderia metallica]|nr:hypothetical protein BME24068_05147 [Burkholderia metallica]
MQKPATAGQPSRVVHTIGSGSKRALRAARGTGRSSIHQRAKSGVLWMNAFSFEMFTLPKPVVASQPAFAL